MKHSKRRSILAALVAVVVMAGIPAIVVGVGSRAAFADDLGYPDIGKPCVRAPYNVVGPCKEADGSNAYAWGNNHDDESGSNIYSSRGYAYRNCTDYVAWKLQSLGVPNSLTSGLGNGGQWAANAANKAGLSTGDTAEAGAAAVMVGNPGHVAYVESVNANGTITVSEYNFDYQGDPHVRTGMPAAMGFTKFVYFGLHMSGTPPNSDDPLADGHFVSYHGAVYRIAGHSPLYVSGSDAAYSDLSGWASATPINDDQWASLRSFPADGAYISDVATGRVYITAGGAPMYISGADAPYLPNWTSAIRVPHWDFENWQHLRQYPVDGYFVRDVQTNAVYETAGGVPLYVSGSDAALLPQWQYATPVPHYEFTTNDHFRLYPVDNTYIMDVQTGRAYVTAGGAPMYISGDDAPFLPQWAGANRVPHWDFVNYQHLRPYPGPGELVTNVRNGNVYTILGGAPMYVSSSDAADFPGWQNATRVPGWDFSAYEHLRQYPDDNMLLRDVQTSQVYITAGGAPLYISSSDAPYFSAWSWGSFKAPHWEFQSYQHLRQYPADNTFLLDAVTGKVYITAGGAPLYISPPGGQYLPNWPNAVRVPDWDFVNYGNLRQIPPDGTYVQGLPSGEVFQMVGGVAVRVTTTPLPAATAVDDWAIVNQLDGTL